MFQRHLAVGTIILPGLLSLEGVVAAAAVAVGADPVRLIIILLGKGILGCLLVALHLSVQIAG